MLRRLPSIARCQLACCVALVAAFVASPSAADPAPSIDFRRFQPPTGADGTLYLESSQTPGSWQGNIGTLFSYSYRPVVLRSSSKEIASKLVGHQLTMDVLGSIGITDYGAIGVALPTVLYQHGDYNAAAASVQGPNKLAAQAVGDFVLTGKASLIRYDLAGFGLGALARITLPTGDPKAYVGEGAATSELRLLAEYHMLAFTAQATTGFKLRTRHRTFVRETWGNEIPWGIGVGVHPRAFGWDDQGRWLWSVEAYGSLPAGPDAPFTSLPQSPAIIGTSARYELVRDLHLSFGVQGPLNGATGVPLVNGVLGVTWAPRFYDMDRDGIDDRDDQCPELAEDFDGFEDHDGCPDYDNDGDGVPDDLDECPLVPEDEDGFEDEDGCPDPDNDGDGILDVQDACPDEAGPANSDPKKHGCPEKDRDGDGIPDELDECPDEPEDKDGFEDDDGCPDPDNDGDGIPDGEDKCPNVPGWPSANPARHGCPIADRDGDTFEDDNDKCPDEPETWNGIDDDDGCPDKGGKPLVTVDKTQAVPTLRLLHPIRFQGTAAAPTIDAQSESTVRAIATMLNHNPNWVLAVAAEPDAAHGEMASIHALSKAFAIVLQLQSWAPHEGAAETVGWEAMQVPTSERRPGQKVPSGVGFLLLEGASEP